MPEEKRNLKKCASYLSFIYSPIHKYSCDSHVLHSVWSLSHSQASAKEPGLGTQLRPDGPSPIPRPRAADGLSGREVMTGLLRKGTAGPWAVRESSLASSWKRGTISREKSRVSRRGKDGTSSILFPLVLRRERDKGKWTFETAERPSTFLWGWHQPARNTGLAPIPPLIRE